tara:strand:+ start:460 stop:1344 length:885 start_codon:yes stop_codon:yes gene_type:complete
MISAAPKTIQIFLPSGEPRGIRVAEVTTRIVQAIEVPRKLLSDFFAMPESKQVAVYFLFGQTEGEGSPEVYVGQSGNLSNRLNTHHKEKEFWQRAVVLISRTQSLTQTHALFLEWFCIQEAKKAGRYKTFNGNGGSKPHTPAPLEADCLEIFDTGRTLLATLGHPLFEPLASAVDSQGKPNELFYCHRSGSKAVGEYTEEGFVVLAGSIGRAKVNSSFETHSFNKQRKKLLAEGKVVIENNMLVFKENVLFGTPSGAAGVVVGSAANGWMEWKNDKGVTLDELKRGNGPTTTEE